MAFNDMAAMFANRCGLNVSLFEYSKGTDAAGVVVDFANECSLDIASDITWATGGQYASKLVGFNNPVEGTFRISTQLMTKQLLALISGADVSGSVDTIVFKNVAAEATIYYVIEADTVWKNPEGTTETEHIVIHKALPKRAYNITYNGAGDPVSVDIEFELMEDDNHEVVTITKGA